VRSTSFSLHSDVFTDEGEAVADVFPVDDGWLVYRWSLTSCRATAGVAGTPPPAPLVDLESTDCVSNECCSLSTDSSSSLPSCTSTHQTRTCKLS